MSKLKELHGAVKRGDTSLVKALPGSRVRALPPRDASTRPVTGASGGVDAYR